MRDNEQPGIGTVARATGLSVRAIRYYEDVGLIRPPQRHDPRAHTGGNRRYDAATVERLRFIRQARSLGLGLDEIRRLAGLLDSGTCPGEAGAVQDILGRHLGSIERHIEELHALHARIEGVLAGSPRSADNGCGDAGCGCLGRDPAPGAAGSGPAPEPRRSGDDFDVIPTHAREDR